MLKKILLTLAAIVVILAIVIATRPDTFHVERSLTVQAPADAVFPLVNDFHHWADWSPWDKLDPSMQRKYEGTPSGVGAKYSWVGNDKVGEGRMTIDESKPSSSVKLTLEFLKPFAATNIATFTLKPSGQGTQVTWSMDGTNNFMAKAFHMVMDMDKMIGGDFEKGLNGINGLAQKEVARRAEEAKKAAEAAEKAAAAAQIAAAAQPVAAVPAVAAPTPAPK